jgi:hypothetical protein
LSNALTRLFGKTRFSRFKPLVKPVCSGEPLSQAFDQWELHLRITQIVEAIQMLFKAAGDLSNLRARQERFQQLNGREQPPGGHSRLMHRFLGEALLASLQIVPITLPLLF